MRQHESCWCWRSPRWYHFLVSAKGYTDLAAEEQVLKERMETQKA